MTVSLLICQTDMKNDRTVSSKRTYWQLKTPVAFIIFNRPDTTSRVFGEIRRVRPPILLVVADGPRLNRQGEVDRCAAARAIIEKVDWPCEVLKNYSETNLGCKRRVSSGLDWVFETVEDAIILEDDCLPDPTFFRFCEELLEHYRDDQQVMHINGNNFQSGCKRGNASYYFSRYPHIWGWASWRRAWKHYDVDLKLWPQVRNSQFLSILLDDDKSVRYWATIFDRTYQGKIDTWDYQWAFACWYNTGLSSTPNQNLVSNIGFGTETTHVQQNEFANMVTTRLEFPLVHPTNIARDFAADTYTEKNNFSGNLVTGNYLDRIAMKLRNIFWKDRTTEKYERRTRLKQ
jgi:hypothetical protein